jgi:hypothetical protein
MRHHAALRSIARVTPLPVTVRGNCMAPLIADGATVQVCARRYYLPGDILVVRGARGGYLAHRLLGAIWRRGGLRYLTCADAGNLPDHAALPSAVLGRVAGGDCAPQAASPPLSARLRALSKLCRCGLQRLRRTAILEV